MHYNCVGINQFLATEGSKSLDLIDKEVYCELQSHLADWHVFCVRLCTCVAAIKNCMDTTIPQSRHRVFGHCLTVTVTPPQSWALSVFFKFFQQQKMIFCNFYQANLTGSGLFK